MTGRGNYNRGTAMQKARATKKVDIKKDSVMNITDEDLIEWALTKVKASVSIEIKEAKPWRCDEKESNEFKVWGIMDVNDTLVATLTKNGNISGLISKFEGGDFVPEWKFVYTLVSA